MIRFSRRGWNNVLIFAILFLIILFNYSHRLMFDDSSNAEQVSLLPDYSEIQQIDFGQHRLQRIGAGWRVLPSVPLTEPDMAAIAAKWTSAAGKVVSWKDLQQAYVVSLQLAGEEKALVFKLKANDDGILIQHQQQLILIAGATLDQFIPPRLQ